MIIDVVVPDDRLTEFAESFGVVLTDYPTTEEARAALRVLVCARLCRHVRSYFVGKQKAAVTFTDVGIIPYQE